MTPIKPASGFQNWRNSSKPPPVTTEIWQAMLDLPWQHNIPLSKPAGLWHFVPPMPLRNLPPDRNRCGGQTPIRHPIHVRLFGLSDGCCQQMLCSTACTVNSVYGLVKHAHCPNFMCLTPMILNRGMPFCNFSFENTVVCW